MTFLQSSAGRFLLIGILSTIINYAVFGLTLGLAWLSYPLASAAGYVSGFFFGYVFNRRWTFGWRMHVRWHARTFLAYASLYGFSLLVGITALKILVEHAGFSPFIANIAAIVLSTVMNYAGCRWIVFSEKTRDRIRMLTSYLAVPFWIVVVIKIAASAFFGSPYLTEGFLPFIHYFVDTLRNPYVQFIDPEAAFRFPYPAGMLAAMSAPFFLLWGALPLGVGLPQPWTDLIVSRLPLLVADSAIYLALCRMLPTRERWVFWLYFASPILFYINYIHGQLDVVPTALLMLALYSLLQSRYWSAFLLLGFGLATKTHLLIALPFLAVYLYRNGMPVFRIAGLAGTALLVFLLVNLPALSPEFFQSVFNNPEQRQLFAIAIPMGERGGRFLLAPALLLLIFYRFSNFRRLNQDSLLLALGLSFTVLVSVIMPMPGWIYWSFPFLVLFISKYPQPPLLAFTALSFSYVAYFAVAWPTRMPMLAENIFFTVFESSLLIASFWSYRTGILLNERYQAQYKRMVLGIAGDSGVGKSTLAAATTKLIGASAIVWLDGDDMHKWQRQDSHWKAMTHLHPKANRLHGNLDHIMALLRGEKIQRKHYDHGHGLFTDPVTLAPQQFIGVQGLHSFLLDSMRRMYDMKIYVEAEENVRIAWKIERDAKERAYDAEAVMAQIASRRADAEKFVLPQRTMADWIIGYKKSGNDLVVCHTMTNSVALDPLLNELAQYPSLTIEHEYADIHHQQIIVQGSIPVEHIGAIAYRLFPHVPDLLGSGQPEFDEGILGVYQLLFIAFLDHLAQSRLHHAYVH